MKRARCIETLKNNLDQKWDVVVIGGGASGLGSAVDAATRGYKTLLLEQYDFAKGTSSRSTKLVHGGVRYLAQGDISLVLEALQERGLLKQNAPHLVNDLEFVIPVYDWWEGPFYTLGMKVYDMMAGNLGLGPSIQLSKEETLDAIPNLKKDDLKGGVIYHDGQFDDSRLAINLAQSFIENGGCAINYCKVTGLSKDDSGLINGLHCKETFEDQEYFIKAKTVINATGVFVDEILKYDNRNHKKTIAPSQGIHLVLDRSFLKGNKAIMIPKTSDGRVLFAVPWHNHVILGTTDTLVNEPVIEPVAQEEEIDFILSTASQYLAKSPTRHDVLSVFAGLRPLATTGDHHSDTKEISRSHKISVSLSGLITISGGKWTTYRQMGEEAINKAILVGGLNAALCQTKNMAIHGFVKHFDIQDHLHVYGSDLSKIQEIIKAKPSLSKLLHNNLPYIEAEVIWAVQEEMCCSIEDFLARRSRSLFLNARASIEMAPRVAKLMAHEMGYDKKWISEQISLFEQVAKNYILMD